jgi:DNA (cytosine-5)-methyltransferase 1
MAEMTHGSLFSGIGGFDLAAEWMGWQNVFHCEWNPFGQRVLKYYWPDAISYNDITKTDFTIHRGRIDILTGGFPCQPYSSAGKRLGKEDDRHLWPEMLRAIREIQPRWVVGENVLGLVNWSDGLVFHEVQADLEAEGYEVQPFVLPAVSVNAPHRRDRVWFVAYSVNRRHSTERKSETKADIIQGINRPAMDSGQPNRAGISRDAPNTGSQRLEGSASKRVQGNERGTNRIYNAKFTGVGKQTNWQNFPTVSPICDGNDGISSRLDGITFSKWRQESIKAGGNAVVPQVVLSIFRTIEDYEKTHAQ